MKCGGAVWPSPPSIPGQTRSQCACTNTSRTGLIPRPQQSRVMGCDARIHRTCSAALWRGDQSVP